MEWIHTGRQHMRILAAIILVTFAIMAVSAPTTAARSEILAPFVQP